MGAPELTKEEKEQYLAQFKTDSGIGGVPDEMFLMDEMFRAEHFDRLISKHSDCDLLIFTTPLPYNVGDMELWSMDETRRPMVSLLFGDVFNLKNAIQQGFILALTHKPDAKFDEETAPSDPEEAFKKRYMIVTPKNIGDVAKKYPKYFQNAN